MCASVQPVGEASHVTVRDATGAPFQARPGLAPRPRRRGLAWLHSEHPGRALGEPAFRCKCCYQRFCVHLCLVCTIAKVERGYLSQVIIKNELPKIELTVCLSSAVGWKGDTLVNNSKNVRPISHRFYTVHRQVSLQTLMSSALNTRLDHILRLPVSGRVCAARAGKKTTAEPKNYNKKNSRSY